MAHHASGSGSGKPLLDRLGNLALVIMAICMIPIALKALIPIETKPVITQPTPVRGTARPDSIVLESDWRKYAAGGHVRGPENARVTIVEFGDYECPYCGRFATTIDRILAAYPDDVRFVYRHWPLPNHRFAYPAARAAECAGDQGRFWPMHDLIYARQDSLGLLSFDSMARRSGVRDLEAFRRCAAATEPVPSIETAMVAVREAGGTGTPTLIVNGVLKRRGIDSAYVASLLAGQR